MRLAPYSTLPPKPSHLRKVLAHLASHEGATFAEVIAQTGLTKTQVGCAMDRLIAEGRITRSRDGKTFKRASEQTHTQQIEKQTATSTGTG